MSTREKEAEMMNAPDSRCIVPMRGWLYLGNPGCSVRVFKFHRPVERAIPGRRSSERRTLERPCASASISIIVTFSLPYQIQVCDK